MQSFNEPELYYKTNVEAVKNLLYLKDKQSYFLQSSSAAIYGNPEVLPVTEDHQANPISVYGKTKLLSEFEVLKYSNSSCLRYFNVLGSDPALKFSTETLVDKVLFNISQGLEPEIYGNSYDTFDGTCIRDYVHVKDVANAHILAINALKNNKVLGAINLGTGIGHSVLDVITEIYKVLDKPLSYSIKPKRKGEISKMIGSIDKAKKLLLYTPLYSLNEMILNSI